MADTITHIPFLEIALGESALGLDMIQKISSIEIESKICAPSRCRIEFDDILVSELESVEMRRGVGISVKVQTDEDALFDGEISTTEWVYLTGKRARLIVESENRLHRLKKNRPLRKHENLFSKELIELIASEAGLSIELSDNGVQLASLFQTGESNFEVLRKIARQNAWYFSISGSELNVFTVLGKQQPALDLSLDDTLLELGIKQSEEFGIEEISGNAWSASTGGSFSSTVTESERSLGSYTFSRESFHSSPAAEHCNESVQSEEELEAILQSSLDFATTNSITAEGVADGNASISPGRKIHFSGISTEFPSDFVVANVRHVFSKEFGFLTHFDTQFPLLPKREGRPIVTQGTVKELDQENARVKVSLDLFGDLETDSLQVLNLGAAPDKGLIIFPDKDDKVLCLFFDSWLSNGIVLGGLYGPGLPSDSGIEDGIAKRYSLLTRGGNKIVFDDALGSISLVDQRGSQIVFAEELTTIHSKVDLVIESPGKGLKLRASRIDFEKA